MWPKSRPRRPAGFCGKQQREKNPVRKEETRPRSMSLLSEKTCPDNGWNLKLPHCKDHKLQARTALPALNVLVLGDEHLRSSSQLCRAKAAQLD